MANGLPAGAAGSQTVGVGAGETLEERWEPNGEPTEAQSLSGSPARCQQIGSRPKIH
jgi:hypothetical protein